MNIKKTFPIALCLGICISSSAQNLIRNPGFEDTGKAYLFWSSPMRNCYGAPLLICHHRGEDRFFEKIPFSSKEGNNCATLSLFQCVTAWSDYLTNPIVPLKKGATYEFSFYITPSDSCLYFSRNIDVLFCNASFFSKEYECATNGKIKTAPTLIFDIATFKITGQEGKWLKLSGSFTAKGDEDMMVIGSFFRKGKTARNASTRIFHYRPNKKLRKTLQCSADYYVDDFSLIKRDE
jgi:hypothetical protein